MGMTRFYKISRLSPSLRNPEGQGQSSVYDMALVGEQLVSCGYPYIFGNSGYYILPNVVAGTKHNVKRY